MQRTILVVDDEPKIVRLVRTYLERAGFRVLCAADGTAALERFYETQPDLVVLDLMIPATDGLDVARRIRKTSQTPIIMLTARGEESDRLVGLELGADDYVAKPFSPRELVARVRAVLRRAPNGGAEQLLEQSHGSVLGRDIIVNGALVVDTIKRQVTCNNRTVPLTSYQFNLLQQLVRQPGRVFSRTQLVEALQTETYEGYERTVDAHMKNIRRALADDARHPRFIETVRGVGYRFLEQE
ncbi:MAG: DNA-binding response regulator [Spirochaetaceae bacterium]|nr:MAG: DNA-binding response regulator [Spirochaetaceae bacterium]